MAGGLRTPYTLIQVGRFCVQAFETFSEFDEGAGYHNLILFCVGKLRGRAINQQTNGATTMKIENRIKALEASQNNPEKKAVLNGETWAMTPEQLQKHNDQLMEKLYAIDISMLEPERAAQIREWRKQYLKVLRDQIELNRTCPGAYRKLTPTQLQILAQND
jgi:hypothetical protein